MSSQTETVVLDKLKEYLKIWCLPNIVIIENLTDKHINLTLKCSFLTRRFSVAKSNVFFVFKISGIWKSMTTNDLLMPLNPRLASHAPHSSFSPPHALHPSFRLTSQTSRGDTRHKYSTQTREVITIIVNAFIFWEFYPNPPLLVVPPLNK